jgi:hypothetical protein
MSLDYPDRLYRQVFSKQQSEVALGMSINIQSILHICRTPELLQKGTKLCTAS